MSFLRAIPGIRHAETRRGDTLQSIALRELGDASLWVDLALLNELRPPYLVDDPEPAGPGVLTTGSLIAVPAPVSVATSETDPDRVFLADLALSGGVLSVDAGDLVLVAGVPNLTQALRLRVQTLKRDLGFHPEYGCWVHTLLGHVNGPTAGQVAAFYVKSALLEEERVSEVRSCVATVRGDAIVVDAVVVAIGSRPVDVQVSI